MNKPLFSVVVITYNSSKYVLETLESIKNQTYLKIELIISDDCSRDNTVQLCQNWLEENQNHFENTNLVTTTENSGIPANCNNGVDASKGDWVKIIAGDDILLSSAISDYVNYIHSSKNNPEIVFSRIAKFEDSPKNFQEIFNNKISNYILFHPDLTQKDQTKLFCRGQLIKIITMVFSRKMFDDVGGFEEKYPLREDRPFLYKILTLGYKLYFMDALTFLYRQHDESIMRVHKNKQRLLQIKIDNIWAPQIKYRFPNLTMLEKRLALIHYINDKTQIKLLSGRKVYRLKYFFTYSLSKLIKYVERLMAYAFMKKYKSKYKNTFSYNEIKN